MHANNSGIFLTVGDEGPRPRQPSPSADQANPRGSYVYAHLDGVGTPFYIGTGTGRRAWNEKRHYLWHRYVEKHLAGKFRVLILEDDLSPEQAELAESEWIAQASDTLVNWVNMSRGYDSEALDRFHRLRDANRTAFDSARQLESSDLAGAVQSYIACVERLSHYAGVRTELGLIRKLLDEEDEEGGINGELAILDRLTLCLVKLGKGREALDAADAYFDRYRRDATMAAAAAIRKRVAKAAALGATQRSI